jgi:hypothetical protein
MMMLIRLKPESVCRVLGVNASSLPTLKTALDKIVRLSEHDTYILSMTHVGMLLEFDDIRAASSLVMRPLVDALVKSEHLDDHCSKLVVRDSPIFQVKGADAGETIQQYAGHGIQVVEKAGKLWAARYHPKLTKKFVAPPLDLWSNVWVQIDGNVTKGRVTSVCNPGDNDYQYTISTDRNATAVVRSSEHRVCAVRKP